MNTEDLAQRLADGETIDWGLIDESDPVIAALKKISKYYQGITNSSDTKPTQSVQRLGEWGNLQLIESIGHGSYGEVFRAFDPVLQRDVALKVVRNPQECMLDSDDFIAEAQRLAQVRHRNVMAVYGAAYHQNEVGFWCELLLGQTLETALSSEQHFPWGLSLQIMRNLSQALLAVHGAGLIHGDIKSANVMLEPERGAVLLDFGAGIDTQSQHRALGIAQGTPMVMAPELFEGQGVSQSSDIYAMGVLFYRLVAGKYPNSGKTYEEIQTKALAGPEISRKTLPAYPREFRVLLRGMLERDPNKRITAAALVDRIDWLISIPARKVKRIVTGAIASLLLGITLASSLGYWFSSKAEKQMELARTETQSVNKVLTNMLASASPLNDGKDVRVVDVLSHAEIELQQRSGLSDEVKSEVLITLASTYLALRELDHAERILDELLLDTTPETQREWQIKNQLAQVYIAQRAWPRAIAMSENAIELATALDAESDMVLESEITLAGSFAEHNEPEVALARLQHAVSNFPEASMDQLGRAFMVSGRLHEQLGQQAEAQIQYQHAAESFSSANGVYNSNTIGANAAVASVLGQQGKGIEAANLLRQQLDIATDYLGLDHKITFNIRMNLGAVLADFGETEAALEVQRSVYTSSAAAFGADGLQTLLTSGNIATLLVETNRMEEAELIYRDNISRLIDKHPDEHNYRLIQQFNLAELLNLLGRYDESRQLAVESLEAATTHLGEVSIVGMELYESIARSDLGLGNPELAASEFAISVQTKTEHLGESHPLTANAMVRQGDALLALGRTDEARALFTRALKSREEVFGKDHSETQALASRLAEL